MEKETFNKLMGEHIRDLRQSKGLTQSDIASSMGVNFQNISAIERGEVAPTVFWITNLCNGLGIEPETFFQSFYKKLKQ
jgi:putative transcriptional regulator